MTVTGERIRSLRSSRNMTMVQLAQRAQTSVAEISRLEAGKRLSPSAAQLTRIAHALNTNTEYLSGASDDPRPSGSFGIPQLELVPLVERLAVLPPEQRAQVLAVAHRILDLMDAARFAERQTSELDGLVQRMSDQQARELLLLARGLVKDASVEDQG